MTRSRSAHRGNGLGRDLPTDPVRFLGEDDEPTVSQGSERCRDTAEAAADDGDVAAQLRSDVVGQQQKAARLFEEVPAIRQIGHAPAS
jgi:hypothetical protein